MDANQLQDYKTNCDHAYTKNPFHALQVGKLQDKLTKKKSIIKRVQSKNSEYNKKK